MSVAGADRPAQTEAAIASYRQAIELLEAAGKPSAALLLNLATVLIERTEGLRAENVDDAIDLLERALTLPMEPPIESSVKLALANALGQQLTRDKAEAMERAVDLVNDVVAYREAGATPFRQAAAHNSRGILYAHRIRGSRADNGQQAVLSFRRALDVYDAGSHPRDRAGALNNLATVLRDHPFGSREDNENESIKVLEEALTIYTRDTDPYSWAGTMSNLGTSWFERRTGNLNENIDRAVEAYGEALQVRTEPTYPWEWAATQFNIGQAYWRRHRGSREDNLREAADALEACLRVRTRALAPVEWAAAQSMLGVVFDELADLGHVPRAKAIHAYELARDIYRPDSFPLDCRSNAKNYAGALLAAGDFAKALDIAREGIDAAEILYGSAPTEDARELEAREDAALYRIATEAALGAGLPDAEAFTLAEAGRGRLLTDWLAAGPLDAPPELDSRLVAEESAALAELREAVLGAREASSSDQRVSAVAAAERARSSLDHVWTQMSSEPAGQRYLAVRRGERLSADRLQQWLDEQPGKPGIVVMAALSRRPVTFCAVAGGDGPVALDLPVTNDEVDGYLRQLDIEILSARRPRATESWSQIGEVFIGPALNRMEDVSHLYVVPTGGLHGVPWHASQVDGEPLITRLPVIYEPGAAAGARMSRSDRPALLPGSDSTVVGDPIDNLPNARAEASAVAQRLGVHALLGEEATTSAVREALATTAWAHLAAHGHYSAGDPLASGVVLADGTLTARQLLRIKVPQILVVSTCESGRQLAEAGDELWGLARALLYAGASTAILSLWRVVDSVTKDFMLAFYEALLSENVASNVPHVADALREAMLTTRERHPETFLWAPFALLGNPW